MDKRRKIVLDNSSRIMRAISLKSDRSVFEAIINETIEEDINFTDSSLELKEKQTEINKLNDLLKDTEEDEGLKLNNPIEWGRRVGYLEGKINYICSL